MSGLSRGQRDHLQELWAAYMRETGETIGYRAWLARHYLPQHKQASAGRGRYLGADAALDHDDEHCNWCSRGGEMQSFEGRLFCGDDCANAWWWEWGNDT